MALRVQKFGGSSVGSVERIQAVARRVLETRNDGDDVLVVVSAMAGETDRLVKLATAIHPQPASQAYDALLASGEQMSVGLLSLAIDREAERQGQASPLARPVLGYQLGLQTDRAYSKARIEQMDDAFLKEQLSAGRIPVIAGFQGVDADDQITTLGRGGSDTSAVAVAAGMGADECEILTDVEGVFTTDPRDYPSACKMKRVSYEEMMELASLGAKVLQIRSVELAAKHKIPLHVRSSFTKKEGTRVVSKDELGKMEDVLVSGVAADRNQLLLSVKNLPAQAELTSHLFRELAQANVVVDVITQVLPEKGLTDLNFTVGKDELQKTRGVLDEVLKQAPRSRVVEDEDIAKVSVVGVGMQNHPGVAQTMFQIFCDAGIETKLITTSEIKISCLIPLDQTKKAVKVLHQGFGLDALEV